MLSPYRFFRNKRYISLLRLMKFNESPIIICGCGRSGTTLFLSILSSHSGLHAIDFETKVFTKRPFRFAFINHAYHLYRIYLILIGRPIKKSARRWVEKNPRNIEYLPQILEEFGSNVKVINIVRDGRDVITSKHPETSNKGYHVEPERWINAVEMSLRHKDHPQVYTLRYEDLLESFDQTMSGVFQFLHIEQEDLKEFHTKSQVVKHRAWQGDVKPLHSTSIRKWEADEFKNRIAGFMQNKKALELLKSYGYV